MRMADPQYVMKLESRLMSMEKKLQEQNSAGRWANGESTTAGAVPGGPAFCNSLQGGPVGDMQQASVTGNTTPGTDKEDSVNKTPDQHKSLGSSTGEYTLPSGFSELDQMLYNCDETLVLEEPPSPESNFEDVSSLPRTLIDVLVGQFYHKTYSIFPIIREPEFRHQLDQWAATGQDGSGFMPVLYALLAVSASILPNDHAVFELPEVRGYKSLDLGDLISSHANSQLSLKSYKADKLARINSVIAHGLLSLYLAEAGQVTEAWVTTGHAIRLYQGLDLYDGASSSNESVDSPGGHSAIWWCLYILDRSLSTVLLKPLAIDDVECDVSSTDGGESHISASEDEIDPWFSVITGFHITMGKIYKSVRSFRKFQHTDKGDSNEILVSRLKNHDMELEQYYEKQVLPNMRNNLDDPQRMGLQTIAVSSYFIGVVLLYRQFIEMFRIEDPQIYLRCAEAASNCIRLTPKVLATVPASHFMIQQSRSIYVGSKVLLHCMRLVRNESFSNKAWDDVHMGLEMLRKIKIQWPEIKKYQKLTEDDMRLTKSELDRHETFGKTFDRFTSLSGDEIYYRLSSSNRSLSNGGLGSATRHCRDRARSGIDTDDTRDTQRKSKRQKPSAPCNSLSPDLSGLFQAGGSEMGDDDFTMSFMLDLAAFTPATALASTNLYEDGVS
ncbi:hypothetical protein MHUMG1_04647 [Metarhizium humberi]|uniref:Xylanolytic transcriptional activator regulatory domain-containing protein n=1 Tax=Metarhizium humberi TaxID=2596975 RepID=A0A9P8MAR5_9HYPO|nr:hypothetical protein MHUMG1_04647 [Metarhizium humberi]